MLMSISAVVGVLFAVPRYAYAQIENLALCYTVQRNCQVVGLTPIDTISGIRDPATCLQLCLQTNGCRATTFETFRYKCNFYAETASSAAGTLIETFGVDYYEVQPGCISTRPTTSTTVSTTPPGFPPEATCPPSKELVFFATAGSNLDADPIAEFENVENQANCADLCRKNKDPDGNAIGCISAVYNGVEETCIFYEDKGPDRAGGADLVEESGVTYLEKVCIPKSSKCPSPPPDVFAYEPRKLLVGHAFEQLNTDTFDECLEACVKRSPICKSGHYFFDDGECNLKDIDAEDDPDIFIDAGDEDEDVVYFGNGCVTGGARRKTLRDEANLNDSKWSRWGGCKTVERSIRTKYRVRTRQCSTKGKCYQYRRCRFTFLNEVVRRAV